MNSLLIAARITSEMSIKKESKFVHFKINCIKGNYNCVLHKNKLKRNSKFEMGSLIQLEATTIKSNELLIAYYVIIPKEKKCQVIL